MISLSLSRHRIDSLATLLPYLKDSGRIDCLNKLSLEFYINALSETYINVQTDTANAFASQAYHKAININYKNGVAEALQHLGEIASDRVTLLQQKIISASLCLCLKKYMPAKNIAGLT